VLVLDAAPGDLLDQELSRLVGHGLAVTLNLRRIPAAARDAVRARWRDRVGFTDLDAFAEPELTATVVRGGIGFDAVKSRAGYPLRDGFLTAASAPGLARPLRAIGRAGSGADHVDQAAAARLGITVTTTPGSNAEAVAEFALAQLLTLSRDLLGHNARSHQGEWHSPGPARALCELRLGILGAGRIGRALAVRATALGMRVAALTRRPAELPPGVDRAGSLASLLTGNDVLSVHLPLTPRTRGLIGRAELATVPPGAILLNTARGGIVDEQALAEALADPAHPLAAAAVDTFAHEHAAFASPLFGLPNALLTPHVAGMTRDAMRTAALRCADQLAALLLPAADR
jgi:D-3-phosphoglycerate dehydrogenase